MAAAHGGAPCSGAAAPAWRPAARPTGAPRCPPRGTPRTPPRGPPRRLWQPAWRATRRPAPAAASATDAAVTEPWSGMHGTGGPKAVKIQHGAGAERLSRPAGRQLEPFSADSLLAAADACLMLGVACSMT